MSVSNYTYPNLMQIYPVEWTIAYFDTHFKVSYIQSWAPLL